MQITHLEIRGLYGYLNKDIDFNSDISILVGINGSGKTTILNLISWLLQPSIPHLCTTEFKSVCLRFTVENKEYTITCTQDGRKFLYSLTHPEKKNLNPLKVNMAKRPSELRTATHQEELRRTAYNHLTPDEKELPTWAEIQKISSPIVVGLERNIGGDGVEMHVSESKSLSLGYHPEIDVYRESKSPMNRVQQLAQEAFSKYRSMIIELNDEFRDQIMMLAFDSGMLKSVSSKQGATKRNSLSAEKIDELEERISKFFAQESTLRPKSKNSRRGSRDVSKMAHSYLAQLKKLLPEKNRSKTTSDSISAKRIMLENQFDRLNRLMQHAENFEQKANLASHEIESYLQIINGFFCDSAKSVYFDPLTGAMQFRLFDESKAVVNEGKSVEVLSSGERQILVLLTYLAFVPGKVFIIDEPELSLHPKWQEDFMDAIKLIMPASTQLVLATHSPAFVGKNTQYCKPLLPFNR